MSEVSNRSDCLTPPAGPVSLGFKEQNVVCESLAAGLQVFVPRKGGLDDFDEDGGLRIERRPLALLPARFHQDADTVRPDCRNRLPPLREKVEGEFRVTLLAQVAGALLLDRIEQVEAVMPEQAFVDAVLHERFAYRTPGLHLLLLRVWRLPSPAIVPDDDRTAGCRSWVELPDPIDPAGATPVIDCDEFQKRCDAVRAAIG